MRTSSTQAKIQQWHVMKCYPKSGLIDMQTKFWNTPLPFHWMHEVHSILSTPRIPFWHSWTVFLNGQSQFLEWKYFPKLYAAKFGGMYIESHSAQWHFIFILGASIAQLWFYWGMIYFYMLKVPTASQTQVMSINLLAFHYRRKRIW